MANKPSMKAKAELDDELLRTAQKYFRKKDLNALPNEALKALIHVEASRRLAALGGTMPDLKPIKRTRSRP
jgi:Bacterial antitoxin of type II TA system, VapB